LRLLCSIGFYKNMNERQSDTHLYTYYANDTLNEKTVTDSYAAG